MGDDRRDDEQQDAVPAGPGIVDVTARDDGSDDAVAPRDVLSMRRTAPPDDDAPDEDGDVPKQQSDDLEELPRGTALGRFSILGRIGVSAGSDALYAAFDPDADRKIAIKLARIHVDEGDADFEAAQRRTIREAQRIARVDHPCVVRVFEVGTFRDRVFLAMEFIDGIDLQHWMEARDDPFPWPEVVRVFHEAGRGLAAAHKAGVVHRDFRPANVMLGKNGRICVLDFGLSRRPVEEEIDDVDISELRSSYPGEHVTGDDDAFGVTHPGTLGTPAYMAPEVHVSGKADHRSDQFSFCVALYEALYGERPFAGNRPIALALEAVHHNVRPAPAKTDVPQWLRDVVLCGLSPQPAHRYRSMEALLRDLAHDPRASRRRWAIGGALTIGALGAGLATAWQMATEPEECEPDPERLSAAWGQQRRDVLRNVIVASERPWTDDTWSTIENHVDVWVAKWTELHRLACWSTRVWGDADEDLLRRRMTCLDNHLRQVEALGRVVEAGAPDVLDGAHHIVAGMASPGACFDDAALLGMPLPREQDIERIEELRDDMHEAWAYHRVGRHRLALQRARSVEDALQAIDYPPLLVDTFLLIGVAQRALGDPHNAEAALHQAALMATRWSTDRLLTRAWVELAATMGELGHHDDAALWLDHAEALADRQPHDQEALLSSIARARGDVAASQGKPAIAQRHYHEAIAREQARADTFSLRLAPLWVRLGHVALAGGDLVAADQHLQRARAIVQSRLAPRHPEIAAIDVALATVDAQRGAGDEAVAKLQEAIEVGRRAGDEAGAAETSLQLADLLRSLGRYAEAGPLYADAETLLRSNGRPVRAADAAYGRGVLERERGTLDASRDSLRRAIGSLEGADDPIRLARFQFALAQVLDERQPPDAIDPEADDLSRAASEAFRAAGPEHATDLLAVETWRAQRATRAEHGEDEPADAPPSRDPAQDDAVADGGDAG